MAGNSNFKLRIVFYFGDLKNESLFLKKSHLFYVVTVKSTVEILQNFVAFSEYMNFITNMIWRKISSGLMGGSCLNIGVNRLGRFIMFDCNADFYSMEMILVKKPCIWFTFSKCKIGNSMASAQNIFLKEHFFTYFLN